MNPIKDLIDSLKEKGVDITIIRDDSDNKEKGKVNGMEAFRKIIIQKLIDSANKTMNELKNDKSISNYHKVELSTEIMEAVSEVRQDVDLIDKEHLIKLKDCFIISKEFFTNALSDEIDNLDKHITKLYPEGVKKEKENTSKIVKEEATIKYLQDMSKDELIDIIRKRL